MPYGLVPYWNDNELDEVMIMFVPVFEFSSMNVEMKGKAKGNWVCGCTRWIPEVYRVKEVGLMELEN